MKYNLPASLYWLTSALGCSAILDSSDFISSISKGTWFVKFYAPWCKYSKKLAPEWSKLSSQYVSLKEKEFYFGEVDCSSHVEVCKKAKIQAYPSIFLYHDGVYIDKFDQDAVPELTAENIASYVIRKAEKYNPN